MHSIIKTDKSEVCAIHLCVPHVISHKLLQATEEHLKRIYAEIWH